MDLRLIFGTSNELLAGDGEEGRKVAYGLATSLALSVKLEFSLNPVQLPF